jgi:hypothetical protein
LLSGEDDFLDLDSLYGLLPIHESRQERLTGDRLRRRLHPFLLSSEKPERFTHPGTMMKNDLASLPPRGRRMPGGLGMG